MTAPGREAIYPLVWRWKKRMGDRKGQRCRILARGKMNTVEVEFEDGFRAFTSGNALRRLAPPTESAK